MTAQKQFFNIHRTVVDQIRSRVGVYTMTGLIYELNMVGSRIAKVLSNRTDVNFEPHPGFPLDENWRLDCARRYLEDVILPRVTVARANAAAYDLGGIIASDEPVTGETLSRVVDDGIFTGRPRC